MTVTVNRLPEWIRHEDRTVELVLVIGYLCATDEISEESALAVVHSATGKPFRDVAHPVAGLRRLIADALDCDMDPEGYGVDNDLRPGQGVTWQQWGEVEAEQLRDAARDLATRLCDGAR